LHEKTAMKRNNITVDIDTALVRFGEWLVSEGWHGKEHDCVNAFAHGFLMDRINNAGLLFHPAQICIECGLRQPDGFERSHARRDLVVWKKPFHNTWILDGDNECQPLAFMEWKTKFKKRLPKAIFYPHDEEWVAKYTAAHEDVVGWVAAVYFLPAGPTIFWKRARKGVFSEVKQSGIRAEQARGEQRITRIEPKDAP
jgi:hypothetical protein